MGFPPGAILHAFAVIVCFGLSLGMIAPQLVPARSLTRKSLKARWRK